MLNPLRKIESLDEVELDMDGSYAAVNWAQQAFHAGFDDHNQLMDGIRGYLMDVHNNRRKQIIGCIPLVPAFLIAVFVLFMLS